MGVKSNWLLATTVTVLLVACSEPPQAGAAAAMPAPEVEVVHITSGQIALTTELPGRTTDFRQAQIRPQVNGILQQRLFTEGQMVNAGDVLYQIDAAPYQASLANAKANLQSAKAVEHNARLKAERFKGLLGGKAVSQQDYDDATAALMQAQAAVASAEAAVNSAQINLNYTRITAPISGQIGRSDVTEGALLTANQTQVMATIRQLDPIYVDLTQSSTELLQLKRQMQHDDAAVSVDLLLDDGSEYANKGSLQFSEANVDPGTGMVTLRAVFPNSKGELLPGMFVRARLHHGTDNNAVLVPQRAVSRTPKGQASVMLVSQDNTVQCQIIETGRIVGTDYQVLSGLKVGDTVVVAGLQKIRPGATVRTVTAAADRQTVAQ